MRITYIAAAQIPSRAAQSIQVMRMGQAFAELGHAVTLIVPSSPRREDVFNYYGVEPSFSIKRLPRLRLKEWGLSLWGLHAAFEAKRCKPDLVYCRQVHACYFAALLGFRVILEIHEPPNALLSKRFFRRLIAMPGLVRIVTNSKALGSLLEREFGLGNDRLLAAPNGAEDLGYIPAAASRNGIRLQVGYVGHLYGGRGIELIMHMVRACPWADFHLVGGTDEDLKIWRSRFQGFSNVTLHGFVPPFMAERYRQLCDVLVAPYQRETLTRSRRNQAGYMSPLKLFEYMASGRAILCSDLPVLHEIVQEGMTALLCDPDKPEEWASALQRLKVDPDLRRYLSENARTAFLRDFTRTARATKVLSGVMNSNRGD